ncbi:iron-siderophore ABC transporter substrate-binding protein [Mycobacterium syngnathidarum]|uniref:iron-siderophore ABC transporter substrate-binding protein n=1 Tax=Mycobacterium syngnathidarum TaxID=1908205 RepID=UPI00095F049C|nr:iron-siderophore ABC transporter substrate-binding protein [Mycobacterium syngnathidarum]OLT97795.1 Fe3+-citrate ABC transporter substrate-binding protein [Mycobacterium syngnathidarum]
MLTNRPRAALAVIAAAATLASGCGSAEQTQQAQTSMSTSVTKIADAGVLGNQRRPDESCAAEPAAADQSAREVRNARGDRAEGSAISESTEVRGDPQRIVALSGDQLDALCALGLQSRIVAAALPDGSSEQPSYLGAVVHGVAPAGSRNAPDLDAIKAANPELILGSASLAPASFDALSAIAPTVFTGAPGAAWRDTLRTVGEATGRAEAAADLIAKFDDAARDTGAQNDAAHFQASVVQLTENSVRVYGADTFAGSVLAAVGLDRPAAQRFTDKPYVELGTTDADYRIADADIVYVSFASSAARDHAPKILHSTAWRDLSAAKDNRVFVVNNEVWQTGQNIVAARGILDDLRWVNAPIN